MTAFDSSFDPRGLHRGLQLSHMQPLLSWDILTLLRYAPHQTSSADRPQKLWKRKGVRATHMQIDHTHKHKYYCIFIVSNQSWTDKSHLRGLLLSCILKLNMRSNRSNTCTQAHMLSLHLILLAPSTPFSSSFSTIQYVLGAVCYRVVLFAANYFPFALIYLLPFFTE